MDSSAFVRESERVGVELPVRNPWTRQAGTLECTGGRLIYTNTGTITDFKIREIHTASLINKPQYPLAIAALGFAVLSVGAALGFGVGAPFSPVVPLSFAGAALLLVGIAVVRTQPHLTVETPTGRFTVCVEDAPQEDVTRVFKRIHNH